MRREDNAYLLDMLLAACDIIDFSAGMTFVEFDASRLHQNAILKSMEIIGEAAGHVSSGLKAAHPAIPWHKIIGMRHRLVHGYFEIHLTRIWDTVQNDIPHLISLLEPLVPSDGCDGGHRVGMRRDN